MKKELFLIASAAALFAACVNTEILRDYDIPQESENDGAILFTSFADNVTKGNVENSDTLYTWSFYAHQDSFQVWGRKSSQPTHEIFDTKVKVKYEGGIYTYTYAPARFWDKSATKYHFYAAAPADGSWNFVDTGIDSEANLGKGYFTTSATLNGVNLQSMTNNPIATGDHTSLKNTFKSATLADVTKKDIDKLIAAPCEVPQTFYNKAVPEAVHLNFIHILSKLNITISSSIYDADHQYDVKLIEFEIDSIPNKGDFTESAIPEGKKAIRWELTNNAVTERPNTTKILTELENTPDTITLDAPSSATTTGTKLYIVESLVIPQSIKYERVALDGQEHDAVNQDSVPFASYEEYTKARHDDVPRLSKAQFDSLFTTSGARRFRTFAEYHQVPGEAEIDEPEFKQRIQKAIKTPKMNILAYSKPQEPYFKIKYSIDGDIFTQYFNLAAAFLGYTNNSQKKNSDGNFIDLAGGDATTYPFYEGWQNTLHIIINPTAITFTADVAEWADIDAQEYEIEQGNVNP